MSRVFEAIFVGGPVDRQWRMVERHRRSVKVEAVQHPLPLGDPMERANPTPTWYDSFDVPVERKQGTRVAVRIYFVRGTDPVEAMLSVLRAYAP